MCHILAVGKQNREAAYKKGLCSRSIINSFLYTRYDDDMLFVDPLSLESSFLLKFILGDAPSPIFFYEIKIKILMEIKCCYAIVMLLDNISRHQLGSIPRRKKSVTAKPGQQFFPFHLKNVNLNSDNFICSDKKNPFFQPPFLSPVFIVPFLLCDYHYS